MAILALALMPTISRAWGLGAAGPDAHSLVEVCTAEGVRMVPWADGPSEPAAAHHADALERCAHCVLGAAPLALPPAAPTWHSPDARAQALPTLFLRAPHTLHVWGAAQPRAPPIHS